MGVEREDSEFLLPREETVENKSDETIEVMDDSTSF